MKSNPFYEYSEDDFLMISGIQHYTFCPRQWALIHIENQWIENYLTVDGQFIHERVHNKELYQNKNGIKLIRGMTVHSRILGVYGVCDMVELSNDIYTPVEYKRGKPKTHDADELQLTLQAMCLEEMLYTQINEGFLYYAQTKHRKKVVIDSDLRHRVKEMLQTMHDLFRKGYVPKVKKKKECQSCSLYNACLPQIFKSGDPKKYIDQTIKEIIQDEEAP